MMRVPLDSRFFTMLFCIVMVASLYGRSPAPVVLSTDIGSDIDDTWALAHILRTSQLDLKMVLTETGEATYRGMVAAKLLEMAERTDVEIALDGANYQQVWCASQDDLLRAVIENDCIWAPRVPWMKCDFFATATSTLFDDVAVYMAYDGRLLEYETIRFSVDDEGYTLRDPEGPSESRVAIRWKDLQAFEDHLTRQWLSHP